MNGINGKQVTPFRSALSQIAAVSVKNVLLLVYGMTMGFPTILIPKLSGDVPGEHIILGDEEKSWIGSIHLVTVPFGCLISGIITNSIGRRRTMQLLNIPFVLSWLLFYVSNEAWHVYLALGMTGFVGGVMEAPVLTYVAEVTEPRVRGMLCTTSTLSLNSGILWTFFFGTFLPWRTVVLVNCVIPVLSFALLMFVPESPYWLIEKNRLNDARKSIAWLRGWTTTNEVEPEFQQLCKHLCKTVNSNTDKISVANDQIIDPTLVPVYKKLSTTEALKLFTERHFLWPFFTVSFCLFLSHFGGNSNVQVYAVEIFAALRTPIDKYYATILVGFVQLLGVVTATVLISFLGKRIINFICLLGSALSFVIVGIYCQVIGIMTLQSNTSTNVTSSETSTASYLQEISWLPMTLIIVTAFLGNAGAKMLPWLLISEIFSSEVKPTAAGISSAVGYFFGFISNKCFLALVRGITLPGVMWFFTSVCILGFLVLYYILPETEGKSLFEISDHYAGIKKIDNKVYRKRKELDGCVNKAFENEKFTKTDNTETIF